MTRVLTAGALFVSIVFFPWWVSVAIAVVLAFLGTAYEVIVAGILLDALYSPPTIGYFGVGLVFTVGAIFLLVVAEYAKEHVTFGV